MPRPNRELTPWEIAARRRNAQKSTGPRTREGKRRAALNALKWRLCPRGEEERLAARGENPGEFRRLYRDLIALLKPFGEGLDRLLGQLTVEFWEKLRVRRAAPRPADVELRLIEIDRRIEVTLARLVAALVVRTRSWYRHLTSTLGGFIASPAELRRRIEGRLSLFGGAILYLTANGNFAQHANLFRMKKLADGCQKTNLLLISAVLSTRYMRLGPGLGLKSVDGTIADLSRLLKRLVPGIGPL